MPAATIDRLLAAIGDAAALAAVLFAYLALRKANETIREAKALRLDSERAASDARQAGEALTQATLDAAAEARQAAKEAAQDRLAATEAARAERLEAEKQHLIRRVERVGQLVEEIFWKAQADRVFTPEPRNWMEPRNRLRQALVGLRERLPMCTAILDASSATLAMGQASRPGTKSS